MSKTVEAQTGDLVARDGRHVGDERRLGEILDVLGESGCECFRVLLDDRRESVLYPDGCSIHLERRGRSTREERP